MKALAACAKDLPWLSPAAASLRTLARSPLSSVWPELRADPGIVLLLARARGRRPVSTSHRSCDVRVLRGALQHLQNQPATGFVDWAQPGCNTIYDNALGQAHLATAIAALVPGSDPHEAWVGGIVASLGWLVACAADAGAVERLVDAAEQGAHSDFDPAALARRVGHTWGLPPALLAIAGRLSLPGEMAVRLGADPVFFPLVQLAVLLHQRNHGVPWLAVGAEIGELIGELGLNVEQVEALARNRTGTPARMWEAPASQPLLVDLLELALHNRTRGDAARMERLHRDIDRLQEGLAARRTEVHRQLHALKVAALAEFAAGAGHEINNPLAVISGQAQYLLRQLELLDGPADEIDNPLEYLANLRGEVVPSLHKIISQAQRIHGILTDLMQFARPAAPKLQAVDLGDVLGDARCSLQALADGRGVRLVCDEPTTDVIIRADPAQLRTSLAALLRNAIEAAPAGGWAGVRVEYVDADRVALVVEDTGPGPGPVAQQHLFDPFYSGRSAGRGRGLGLPTAWRLTRQQDGDLHFDGTHDGVTRFRLVLPLLADTAAAVHANGCNGTSHLA
jgi:signal transduction histidine kinase